MQQSKSDSNTVILQKCVTAPNLSCLIEEAAHRIVNCQHNQHVSKPEHVPPCKFNNSSTQNVYADESA